MKKEKKCDHHLWRSMRHDKFDVARYYILICQKCRKKIKVWLASKSDFDRFKKTKDPVIESIKAKKRQSWKNLFGLIFGQKKKKAAENGR